jgi:FixJ family two-component response regulator
LFSKAFSEAIKNRFYSPRLLRQIKVDRSPALYQAAMLPQSNTRPSQPTVVIVDDDMALLGALKFDLELEGFQVETHTAGTQLRLDGLPKDNGCLIIDYRLPGLNGVELLRRLRDRGVDLPAIIITSHPTPSLHARAAGLGGSIIEKPLLGDVLLSGIRSALAEAPRA